MSIQRSRSHSPSDFIPVPAAAKPASASTPCPWASAATLQIEDPLLQLHEEILDFHAYMQPSPQERQAIADVVARVESIVKELWTDAQVRTFGSIETGLWVPGSDLDITVLTEQEIDAQEMINQFASVVLERKIASELERILTAKVPIVKMRDKATNHCVDVCFNIENGVNGVEVVRKYCDRYPEVRYLVCVLKVFLKQRGLNDTYNGGMGSFLLFCTVVAAVQQHASRRRDRGKYRYFTLGHQFMHYLRLFGEDLDYDRVGISIRGEGSFFNKRTKGWKYADRDKPQLALECPQNPDNDLGRGAYNIDLVKKAFEHAYKLMCAQAFKSRGLTPLGCLIRRDQAFDGREGGSRPLSKK